MKLTTKKIAFAAICAGISYVLDYFSIGMGNTIKITIYALPLVLCSLHCGSLTGILAGFVEGLIAQLTSKWGLSITAPFWMIAPMLWGLLPGLIKKLLGNTNISLILSTVVTALIVTIINTGVMFIDYKLVGNTYEFTLLAISLRIISSGCSAILYCILIVSTYKPLSLLFKNKKES